MMTASPTTVAPRDSSSCFNSTSFFPVRRMSSTITTCSPGCSKWPSRSAPVPRSPAPPSSSVGMMCIVPLSIRPTAGQHPGNGLQQNLPVQRQRPVVDVLHVHFHPGLEIHVVPPRDGPQTREPRAPAQPPPLPTLVLLHLPRHRETRPHTPHIPAQHLP